MYNLQCMVKEVNVTVVARDETIQAPVYTDIRSWEMCNFSA